jgi:hypothetical protein
MSADAWSAMAAWIALFISSINAFAILLNRGPEISYKFDEPERDGHYALRFSIAAASRPIYVRSIKLLPNRKATQIFLADGNATMFRDIIRWQDKQKFSGIIPKNETKDILVSFGRVSFPCLLILKWSD